MFFYYPFQGLKNNACTMPSRQMIWQRSRNLLLNTNTWYMPKLTTTIGKILDYSFWDDKVALIITYHSFQHRTLPSHGRGTWGNNILSSRTISRCQRKRTQRIVRFSNYLIFKSSIKSVRKRGFVFSLFDLLNLFDQCDHILT